MSYNDPPPLSGKEMLLVMLSFLAVLAVICLLGFGMVFVVEWFWGNVVCEEWIVCK